MRIETFNPNKDYGTPARVSETLVTVEIDGVEITVPEGTSVMRAASLANINIPKLCATIWNPLVPVVYVLFKLKGDVVTQLHVQQLLMKA